MSRLDKLREKFYSKPIRNDMTFDEIQVIAESYGCIVDIGRGKHSFKVIHRESGTVIPIPRHGSCVKEAYIKQLKDLFDRLKIREED